MWSHSPSSSRNPLIHPSFLQINQKLGRSSQRIINLLKNIHNSLTYTMTVLLPILMYLWIHRYRYWIRESSIFSLFFFFLLQRSLRSLRSSFRQSPLSFLLSPLLLFVTRHIYIFIWPRYPRLDDPLIITDWKNRGRKNCTPVASSIYSPRISSRKWALAYSLQFDRFM